MATVREIYDYLDGLAPFHLQMSFDNSGLLIGRGEQGVAKILVALDITEEVIEEAVQLKAELIISHHPIIFHPAKEITDTSPLGRKLLALIENRIAAICAHTNLDAVKGGVNDVLAHSLGLTNIALLHQEGLDSNGAPYGIGRTGEITEEMSCAQFATFVKERLGANGVRYVDGGKPVHRVAVGGGSCSSMMGEVLAMGCDTFVTSDVKYDSFLDAKAQGLNLIDAGHFPTENIVCPVVAQWLKIGFPQNEILISTRHNEVLSYL